MSTTEAGDFYVGRGEDAEYLGTLDSDADPASIEAWEIFQSWDDDEYTEQDYREEVSLLLSVEQIRPGVYANTGIREHTWPHRHGNSRGTPWSYCYDNGTVYVYRFGVEMAQLRTNLYGMGARQVDTGEGFLLDPSQKVWRRRPPTAKFPYFGGSAALH